MPVLVAVASPQPGVAVPVLSEHAAAPRPTEVGMMSDAVPVEGRGEQIQEAEREAARQRLLAQAEAERIPAEETTRVVPDRRWRRGQQ
ncbi:hypothetical protein MCAG_00268 [Micromonospora sp. ATCC 39149]|nr:hypothetical protein MCAG_00268 [Micromonospora sp. ATCC 39149]